MVDAMMMYNHTAKKCIMVFIFIQCTYKLCFSYKQTVLLKTINLYMRTGIFQ